MFSLKNVMFISKCIVLLFIVFIYRPQAFCLSQEGVLASIDTKSLKNHPSGDTKIVERNFSKGHFQL